MQDPWGCEFPNLITYANVRTKFQQERPRYIVPSNIAHGTLRFQNIYAYLSASTPCAVANQSVSAQANFRPGSCVVHQNFDLGTVLVIRPFFCSRTRQDDPQASASPSK